MFKNVMTYLGLGPDEEYDDRYLADDHDDELDRNRDRGRPVAAGASQRSESETGSSDSWSVDANQSNSAVNSVRPLRPVPVPEDDDWSEPAPSRTRISSAVGGGGLVEESPSHSVRKTKAGSNRSDYIDLDAQDQGRGEPVVRPVPIQRTKPRALTPKTFGDAKVLADDIKNSVPVVMNLRDVDRDLARRLIDFASGVCYSLDASMEKIASQVFLLTPASVEVSGDERRRIEERGFDR